MSGKIIIIATIILLIAGISVLFVIEAKNHSYDYKKMWSVAYFDNPNDDSLDFTIENHQGEYAEYEYKVFIGDNKVINEKAGIEAAAKQNISPILGSEILSGSKIIVIVSYKDAEYKIYKDIK